MLRDSTLHWEFSQRCILRSIGRLCIIFLGVTFRINKIGTIKKSTEKWRQHVSSLKKNLVYWIFCILRLSWILINNCETFKLLKITNQFVHQFNQLDGPKQCIKLWLKGHRGYCVLSKISKMQGCPQRWASEDQCPRFFIILEFLSKNIEMLCYYIIFSFSQFLLFIEC